MKIYSQRKHPQFFNKIIKVFVNRINHAWASEYNRLGFKQLAIFSHDHIGISINNDGIYERELLELIFEWLSPHYAEIRNSSALDIGANIGNHSLFFSDYFSEVHAYEPNPRTFRLLEFNASNRINLHCHMIGLSDKTASGFIGENPTNIGGSRVIREKIDIKNPKNLRPIILDTLDNVAKEISNIFLIKIDVEGFELDVLQGGQDFFSKNTPIILFEQHENDFSSGKSATVEFLKDFGYSFGVIERRWSDTSSSVLRALGLAGRILFGEVYSINVVSEVPQQFHPMIIALPSEFLSTMKH